MYYWIITVSIGIIFLILFLYFRIKERRLIALIFKGLTSLMFISTALISMITHPISNNIFRIFVVIGLVFGLGGDIFLDIKYMTHKHESLFTKLGFISFGIGHIFFIIGLMRYFYIQDMSNNAPLYFIVPLALAVIFTLIAISMEKFTDIKYGEMKMYAIIYGMVLFLVMNMYVSFSLYNSYKVLTLTLMSIGFILFTLSDMVLNKTYFSKGCNTPKYIISNHILYYGAQFIIALSLFFIK